MVAHAIGQTGYQFSIFCLSSKDGLLGESVKGDYKLLLKHLRLIQDKLA